MPLNEQVSTQPAPLCWQLTALRRCSDPYETALSCQGRLLELIRCQPLGAFVTITWAGGNDGQVSVFLQAHGTNQDFAADLEWVSDQWHQWTPLDADAQAQLLPPQPTVLHELVTDAHNAAALSAVTDRIDAWDPATHALHPDQTLPSNGARDMQTWHSLRHPAWSSPKLTNSELLLTTLSQVGGLIRVHIAPADPWEVHMLEESYLTTPQYATLSQSASFFGNPLRVRAFVGSHTTHLPTRLRISLLSWTNNPTLSPPLASDEAQRAWCGGNALVGASQPEGFVRCFARLPVASPIPQILGIPTLSRELPDVPLVDVTDVSAAGNDMRLGTALDSTGKPCEVFFGPEGAMQHMQVLGGSGTGKSTLLASMVRSIAEAGRGGLILDPHGQLVDRILSELPPEAAERTRVIDCADVDGAVPVNLFHCGDFETMCSEYLEIFYTLMDPQRTGIVGPRFERIFRQVAEALHELLGADLPITLIPTLLNDQERLREVIQVIRHRNPDLARALSTEILSNRSSEFAEVLSWVNAKFERMTRTAVIRRILGTGKDAVNMGQVMANNQLLLVKLASPKLGRDASQLLGMMYLAKLALAVPERQHGDPIFHLIVDEAHLFQESLLSEMLAESRKFGLALTLAHQHLGQLPGALRSALEGNASSVVAFRTSVQDAPAVHERLGAWEGGPLSRLPNLRAAVTLSGRGGQTPPFTLRVDYNERAAKYLATTHAEGNAETPGSQAERYSFFELVAPHMLETVKTGPDIDHAIHALRPKVSYVRPVPKSEQSGSERGSYLDEWLEKRKHQLTVQLQADEEK